MAGTLLGRGSSLLAPNEHLPCEMVVPKLSLTLNYRSFSSKCALIALSGEWGGRASDGANGFRANLAR